VPQDFTPFLLPQDFTPFLWKTALFLNLQTSVQLQKQNIRKNFDTFLFEAEKQSRDVLGPLQQHLPLNAMRRTVNATMTRPLQDTVDLNTRRSTQVFLMSVYFSITPFSAEPKQNPERCAVIQPLQAAVRGTGLLDKAPGVKMQHDKAKTFAAMF